MHLHVGLVRPDAITRTGVIQPFPIEQGPADVAAATIESFERLTPGMTVSSGFAGHDGDDLLPEEVAMMANRLATAMAQGYVPEGIIDQRLLQAASMIRNGQPFIIRSAGRAALVRAADAPSSVAALVRRNPASGY